MQSVAFLSALPLGAGGAFRKEGLAVNRHSLRTLRQCTTSCAPRAKVNARKDTRVRSPDVGTNEKTNGCVHTLTRVRPLLRMIVLLPLLSRLPALATTTGLVNAPALAGADPGSFLSGLASSFVLVLASEIGDKTFFISALLSMKYSRWLVLVGTMLALGSMTIISVAIGQIFHALPSSLNTSIPFDDYAAVLLLLWFGVQSVRDGLGMRADEEEELQDAKDVVAGNKSMTGGVRVVAETCSLIFLAEWGDKSMLATVALAAAKNGLGVIVGGISGHLVATMVAIGGGAVLGRFISEKKAKIISGVVFFVFAVLTVIGRY